MPDSPDKQAKRAERAQKVLKWLDPAAGVNAASVHDAVDGPEGAFREADRDYKQIRLTQALLAEQQETNRLLRELINRS